MFIPQKTHISFGKLILALAILALFSFLLSLQLGAFPIKWNDLFSTFPNLSHDVFMNLRLPRTGAAFVTGGLLALAGALMQILLRNPLADPYILGISGGSAVLTLIAMLLNITLLPLPFFAFLGSLLSMLLLFSLVQVHGFHSPSHLLLSGIVVATGWGALISCILTLSPQQHLPGMLFWLMGDLSHASLSLWPFLILLIGLVISFALAPSLNILARGELTAQTLGVNTKKLHFILYILGSLLTATAVSLAGCISFVGLIVPHLLRLCGGNDHRFLLPASVLLGGSFLTLADACSRTLFTPFQLPVGVMTALIGAPCFFILLYRYARS